MTKKLLTFITLAMMFSFTTALADKDKRKGALLNISASDSKEVEEDLLVVNLRFETEGKSPQEVQEKINEKMTKALDEVKKHRKIKVSTEQYSVYKYHPRIKKGEPKKTIWRGSQSLQLKSKHSDIILKTTGVLQSMDLAVNGLNYIVSPELREEVQDSLMEKAVEKLLTKSKRVAKVLGKDDIEVVNININSNNFYPSPMRASSAMMMKDMSAESSPVASPGQSRITTSVSATILIKD
jgi:predicted secreted protein